MPRHGKKYDSAIQRVDKRPYLIDDAFGKLKEVAYAKFDETVEIAMLLGVDPRHADQMVRGTVSLPHGTGQTLRVLAIVGGEKFGEAQEAGADIVWTGPRRSRRSPPASSTSRPSSRLRTSCATSASWARCSAPAAGCRTRRPGP
jgi:hypothetical protein